MMETSFAASKTNCSIIIGYRFYTDMHGFINLVTRKYSHFLPRDATSTVATASRLSVLLSIRDVVVTFT